MGRSSPGPSYDRLRLPRAARSVYIGPVAITVAELVAVPFLRMRFHAGTAGGGRLVTWAHTSDLPNATDWLAPGDLLMSNGLNLPEEAEGQVSFLAQLESAGLSGLAVGDDMHAPPFAPEFIEQAEELAFPVLGIPRDVPFVAISRAVANANSDEEHKRLVQTVQLYEALRGAVTTGTSGATLLRELSRRLDCRVLLLDATTALPVLAAEAEPPADLVDRLVAELQERQGVFPAVLRVESNGANAFAVRVPTTRPTALVALHDAEHEPDLALLQHAANIAALEVERIGAQREQQLRQGAELFAAMLERRIEPASAAQQLGEQGLDPEEAVLIAFRPAAPMVNQRNLHYELAQRDLPHLVLWSPQRCLVALSDTDAAHQALREALDPGVALGISDPLRRADRAPDAAREAQWAQTAAHNLARPVVRYGEATPLFLPRTLGEAELAAERVLGPILAYDEEHATELMRSLSVFLEQNRSWQRSAELLHVHKQTLVYRMHRVEELTGRELRKTADIVELWMALRALELSGTTVGSGSAERS
jgi:PucR family transcriptional regulator, purine catabolism regulatory protein